MKQVSWVLALIVGLVVGFVVRGGIDGRSGPAPSPAAQAPRPRPVEDPRAAYRVSLEDSPVKGPADALVTIVEVSDFECPFCKRVTPTLKQLEQEYAGKVRFVFKQNPLPFHRSALPAAMVAEEARAQGGDAKFWEMHDRLFESAPKLEEADLLAAAQASGLDTNKVKEAIATRKYESRVRRDQQLAASLGATGTPTFFINGRKLVGAQPMESFKAVIEDELKKAQAMVAAGTAPRDLYAKIMATAATSPVYLPGTAPPPTAQNAPPDGARPAAQPAAPSQPSTPPPALYRNATVRSDDPIRGPKAAKVTVVLFSDFQCPFCARVEPTLTQLREEYKDRLRIVWKQQPLVQIHPNAMPAATAAEAAREQGKFWEMHDKLFSDQGALSDATYERYAKELGLDLKRFKATRASPAVTARIAEDQALAQQVGVSGTPTMFFNCRQLVGGRPIDQMKAVVDEELAKADALLAKGAKLDAGFYTKACEANLSQPAPTIPLRADDPALGSPKAPVTLVVFSDFQCPFCSRLEPTLKQVEDAYRNQVRIIWKHQPLSFHPNALPAALAAEAAREQGKFWPMHDKIFQNQSALGDASYTQWAREIGLDMARFDQAYRSQKYRNRILEDQRVASAMGADGTPTMFVNGEKVVGAVPYEQLKSVIDRKLTESKRKM